jgi:hypothetical protein
MEEKRYVILFKNKMALKNVRRKYLYFLENEWENCVKGSIP